MITPKKYTKTQWEKISLENRIKILSKLKTCDYPNQVDAIIEDIMFYKNAILDTITLTETVHKDSVIK